VSDQTGQRDSVHHGYDAPAVDRWKEMGAIMVRKFLLALFATAALVGAAVAAAPAGKASTPTAGPICIEWCAPPK